MRCVFVSWHFSTCAPHPIIVKLQQFSRRSGGHSRRIPGVLRTLVPQAIYLRINMHEREHRSRARSSRLENFCSSVLQWSFNKLKHVLIKGPKIGWSRLGWATPSNAMPCFHMLYFTLRHLHCLIYPSYLRHLRSPSQMDHMLAVHGLHSGRALPEILEELWEYTSFPSLGLNLQTLLRNSRAYLCSLAKRMAA